MFVLSKRPKRFFAPCLLQWNESVCLWPCSVRADQPCRSWFLGFETLIGTSLLCLLPCILDLGCTFVIPRLTVWIFLLVVRYQVKCFPVWAENTEEGFSFIITFWFFSSWVFTASHVGEIPRPTFPTGDTGSKVQILLIKDSFSEDWVVLCYCSSVQINKILLQCRL